jgi:hypothetical protein
VADVPIGLILTPPEETKKKKTRFICSRNDFQGLASFFTNGPSVQKLKETNELIHQLKVAIKCKFISIQAMKAIRVARG